MGPFAVILALALILPAAHAKIFERCELARAFNNAGLGGYKGYSLPNWVCLAYYESTYNTKATNYNPSSKSTDYGVFQINSKWWCNDGKTPNAKNACGISCSELLTDNISKAITCAKRVVSDPNGMGAWVAWNNKCKGKDLSSWTAGCF